MFHVILKLNGVSHGRQIKRAPISQDSDVIELQEIIKTTFGIPFPQQIITYVSRNYEVRLVPGFKLRFFEVGNNQTLEVKSLGPESTSQLTSYPRESELSSHDYNKRLDYISKVFTVLPQRVLEEAEEEQSEEEKILIRLRKQLLWISKSKIKRQVDEFFRDFDPLDRGIQLSILEHPDPAGWPACFYAILNDFRCIILRLIDTLGEEFLNITARDGTTPLFLAIKYHNWFLVESMLQRAQRKHLEMETDEGWTLGEFFAHAPKKIIEETVLSGKANPAVLSCDNRLASEFLPLAIRSNILQLAKAKNMPSVVSIQGSVQCKCLLWGWKDRYLRVNLDSKVIERYRSKVEIPFAPREVIPLSFVKNLKIAMNSCGEGRFYFSIQFEYNSSTYFYRCRDERSSKVWGKFLNLAVDWTRHFEEFMKLHRDTDLSTYIEKVWREKNATNKILNLDIVEDLTEAERLILGTETRSSVAVSLADFSVQTFLGRGAFGKVYKVQHRVTGKVYAMKCLSKRYLIRHNQLKYSLIEREILSANCEKSFLLCLYYAFQSAHHFYLVVDYCPNSDLSLLLAQQPEGRFEEEQVRFFAAEIFLALEELHRRHFIYRDMKPENVLLDEQGHVKLADFGLAAGNISSPMDFAISFCGSPIYLPPEVIKSRRSYQSSDFYSVGVLMYELATGQPPFVVDDLSRLYSAIRKGILTFPRNPALSPELKDLIQRLMRNDPKTRLGAARGVAEVKDHEFFRSIYWDALGRKELESAITLPPPIPEFYEELELRDIESLATQDCCYIEGFDFARFSLVTQG